MLIKVQILSTENPQLSIMCTQAAPRRLPEHLSTYSTQAGLPGQLETGVPMFMRQRAQRGSGFLQPGQLVTFDLVGEPLTPYWLKPRPW